MQDEPNNALLLANRVNKMALSCLLGISHSVAQENSVPFNVLTKLFR